MKSILKAVSVWWYRLLHPRWWWKRFGSRSMKKIASIRDRKFRRGLLLAIGKKHFNKVYTSYKEAINHEQKR